MQAAHSGSLDPAEVAKFERMAAEWWSPDGKFRPLHRLNPLRIGFVRDAICERYGRDPRSLRPLEGLRVLDIGCGGGLLSEPMCRLGAEIIGVDPAPGNIEIARLHAAEGGLRIDYRAATAEDLAAAGETFDVVLALEVVEHVADVDAFLATCASMVRPGGILVLATINRTLKALALAIGGAEYVLRWLPRGTHEYRKFVRPSEAEAALAAAGLDVTRRSGVVFSLADGSWKLSGDMDVNYMLAAARPA
ncbi:MAG TPA: bifunctional 2-polyprenyl-6-hydroxyphenol methylase/3-demethylubiquinol 3-O-methyltransferase UbiG [Arenibaculum sp.]|jgi:2-polyprenyl-6-hydroxyphenyl methylase/3-demethylubiquinone-9 3-methyltransferase|nr:bifunctional 2-polyprenyl-6-hydroxyphenol methylase/3-demethylubiquinol 3-O-methyltransferase UbiG [Arenibaculum sp.]